MTSLENVVSISVPLLSSQNLPSSAEKTYNRLCFLMAEITPVEIVLWAEISGSCFEYLWKLCADMGNLRVFSCIKSWFILSRCQYEEMTCYLHLTLFVSHCNSNLLCLPAFHPHCAHLSRLRAFFLKGGRACLRVTGRVRCQAIFLTHLGAKHPHLHRDLWKVKQRRWYEGHFLSPDNELIIPQSLVVWITMKRGKFTVNPEGGNKSLKWHF